MAAAITDLFQKLGGASSLVNTPKVTVVRAAAGATLTVDNCNWDQTTGKFFATYQVSTSGTVVAGTEIIWKGIVTSSTSIGSLSRVAGATDTGNAIGDYVELLPASAWGNAMATGILTQHNQDGTHGAVTATSLTTSGAVLTTPKVITSLNDTNGNELFKVTATASAVNELTLTNAATANNPSLTASGGDTNIGMNLISKGTGEVQLNGVGASGAWSSWTGTVVGWSGTPSPATKFYKQVGKTVYWAIDYSGTSNSTLTTFTLPVPPATQIVNYSGKCGLTVDNGAITTAGSWDIFTTAGTPVITVFVDNGRVNLWTASGTKQMRLQGFYEAA